MKKAPPSLRMRKVRMMLVMQESLHRLQLLPPLLRALMMMEDPCLWLPPHSPVARLEAIRILLAFAASKGFKLQQMDVKSAFLNGFIEEDVYVRQPPGFESAKFPDWVYKLRKALYGLKQAPRAWYASFAEQMSREFEMSLMGELQFFLGLQIKQGPEGTFVYQAKYTRDILKKFEMGDSKPTMTTMSTNTALDADEDGEAVDQKEF
ncbi:hypothetical protein U9M48_042528 [Paspalum notatum var. saurae]|uniref:Reverse transcriptase Ty1/copia-type domain-containing protein n=1 Tax=Paspalum notatum var. saurae TaxID=547442 RepID=A0AAQ3UV01_PASNO